MTDPHSIWTSTAARARLLALYDARLASLGDAVERHRVVTRRGVTQVLLAGSPRAPALIVIHGANGDAAQMATAYIGLADHHRCVFVDVPGEPTPSEGPRLPRGDGSIAQWMGAVLDALALDGALDRDSLDRDGLAMLGMSGGAYTALRAALGLRERVRCVAGLVPEGFCPLGELPAPTAANAAAFVEAITAPDSGFPGPVLELMTRATALGFEAVREPLHLGPLFEAEDFAGFDVPVLLVAGGRDVLFPGRALLARAQMIVPNLREQLIDHANHVHLSLFRGPAFERVATFLRDPASDGR